jgi:AcrR family transcriptional regulator
MTDSTLGRVTTREQLRERTRRAVRSELAAIAVRMFRERGFDNTTVDDIARAAGLSKRSFFRYFPAKEDAVFDGVTILGEHVAEAIADRPAGESPWDCLHAVLREWEQAINTERQALESLRLIESTPALRARSHQQRDQIREQIAGALQARPGTELDPFTADLITSAAGVALDCVLREWLRSGGHANRTDLIDLAFTQLRPASLP